MRGIVSLLWSGNSWRFSGDVLITKWRRHVGWSVAAALSVSWDSHCYRVWDPGLLWTGTVCLRSGTWNITLMCCALIVFLLCLTIMLACCALFVFYFLHLLRWCVAYYLFSPFLSYYVGVLRTFCFILSLTITLVSCALFLFYFLWLLRLCVAHYFFSTFNCYVGVLRTICFLFSLAITLVCYALFVFYFLYL